MAIKYVGNVATLQFKLSGSAPSFLADSKLTRVAVVNGLLPAQSGNVGTFLKTDGTNLSWAAAALSITDDTSTNSTYYVPLTTSSSGTITSANVSTSKLTFNPSSGLLTSTDYNSSSDMALKENIINIDNPLDIISKLNGFGFNWKDTGEKSYGLSAQQVEEVLPEIVRTRPDGFKGINYLNLIAFLVEAIKDLKQEISELKSK